MNGSEWGKGIKRVLYEMERKCNNACLTSFLTGCGVMQIHHLIACYVSFTCFVIHIAIIIIIRCLFLFLIVNVLNILLNILYILLSVSENTLNK